MTTQQKNPVYGSVKDVMAVTTLSRASVYKFMKNNGFPKPRKISTRSVWLMAEVEQWMQAETEVQS